MMIVVMTDAASSAAITIETKATVRKKDLIAYTYTYIKYTLIAYSDTLIASPC